jgi:phenylacetate-CoA ligase
MDFMLEGQTLRKNGLRSDRLWTRPILYRTFLNKIPVWLDTRALLKSQYWPREKISALQEDRIRSLFDDVSRIPFWEEAFRRAGIDARGQFELSELAMLAPTSKKELRPDQFGYFTDFVHTHARSFDHTSGSTGMPFSFYLDASYELRSYAICERMFRTSGRGMRLPVIAMRARERIGFALGGSGFFFLRSFTSLRYRLSELVRYISSFESGVILYSFSSTLVELARLSAQAHSSLPLRAVIAAGEPLSQAQRLMIERDLDTKVYSSYGTRELGWLAFECDEQRLHINEEWCYMEVVDEAGSPLPPETEGRILVTGFENRIMPFIRYDTGDIGTIREGACACGRSLRTIEITGRKLSFIDFKDGGRVSLLDLSSSFDSFWNTVWHYQVVRTGEYDFLIRAVPGPLFEEAKERLAASIMQALHPKARVEWEVVSEIASGPNGKAKYFIETVETPYA